MPDRLWQAKTPGPREILPTKGTEEYRHGSIPIGSDPRE